MWSTTKAWIHKIQLENKVSKERNNRCKYNRRVQSCYFDLLYGDQWKLYLQCVELCAQSLVAVLKRCPDHKIVCASILNICVILLVSYTDCDSHIKMSCTLHRKKSTSYIIISRENKIRQKFFFYKIVYTGMTNRDEGKFGKFAWERFD